MYSGLNSEVIGLVCFERKRVETLRGECDMPELRASLLGDVQLRARGSSAEV